MSQPRRVHFNATCTGFPWHEDPVERARHVTGDLRRVTCNQCKGKITDVIRGWDWATLSDEELDTILAAASATPTEK